MGRRHIHSLFRNLPMSSTSRGLVYWLPLLIIIFIGFDIPILFLIGWSFGSPFPTLSHYETLVSSNAFFRIYSNTFYISGVVTIICAILGYPLAYWMTKLGTRKQSFAIICVLLSFWISVLVRTYAWIVILGNGGIVNRILQAYGITSEPVSFLYNVTGVTIGMVNILLPYMVLPLYASMRRFDTRLIAAAKSLGASDTAAFFKIFFPLNAPALAASMILVFILSLGFFVTPAILGGGRVIFISNMLDLFINEVPRWGLAAASSVVLLTITLVLYAVSRALTRERA